jgi:hypothetical protein
MHGRVSFPLLGFLWVNICQTFIIRVLQRDYSAYVMRK